MLLALVITQITYAQQKTVTGTVSDSEDGEPLIGVTIVIEGTISGTVTDVMGNYSIVVENEKANIRFSSISYRSQTISVEGT